MATIKNLTFDEILKEVLSTDRVLIVSPDKTAFSNHEYDLKLLGKNVGYLLYVYSMSRREGDRVFETIEYAQEMCITFTGYTLDKVIYLVPDGYLYADVWHSIAEELNVDVLLGKEA